MAYISDLSDDDEDMTPNTPEPYDQSKYKPQRDDLLQQAEIERELISLFGSKLKRDLVFGKSEYITAAYLYRNFQKNIRNRKTKTKYYNNNEHLLIKIKAHFNLNKMPRGSKNFYKTLMNIERVGLIKYFPHEAPNNKNIAQDGKGTGTMIKLTFEKYKSGKHLVVER